MQALSEEQSAFMVHSGLQFGGEPIICGKHEHWHCPPLENGGLLFGPQGLGSQGSSGITGAKATKNSKLY